MKTLRKVLLTLLLARLMLMTGASLNVAMLEVMGGRAVAVTWLIVAVVLLLALTYWLWRSSVAERGGK